MEQKVAAFRLFCHDIQRRGISADDDHLIPRHEAVGIALQGSVADGKRLHADQVILIDDSGRNLFGLHPVAQLIRLFKAMDAEINIHRIGGKDVLRHAPDSFRAEHLQRLVPLQHPGGENQVRIPRRVVGMQVGAEGPGQKIRPQGVDALMIGLGRPSHHAGAEIHQIGPLSHHHGRGRAAGVRAGVWRSGSEQYNLYLHHASPSTFAG